jgi:ABC-type glycerol-3-phosphate transport system substrate-binding protein
MRSSNALTATGWLPILLVLSMGLATMSGCPGEQDPEGGLTEIVFASGPDDTGIVQTLLDGFNEAHRDSIRVTWRVMDRENNAHRRQLVEELESGKSEIDLIASDVIWTAEFAQKRWVEDVTDRFYADYARDAFLKRALDSATWRLGSGASRGSRTRASSSTGRTSSPRAASTPRPRRGTSWPAWRSR